MGTLRPILETMPRHCVDAVARARARVRGCAARARRPCGRGALPAPRRGRRGARPAGAPGARSPPAGPRWACTRAACAAIRRRRSCGRRELLAGDAALDSGDLRDRRARLRPGADSASSSCGPATSASPIAHLRAGRAAPVDAGSDWTRARGRARTSRGAAPSAARSRARCASAAEAVGARRAPRLGAVGAGRVPPTASAAVAIQRGQRERGRAVCVARASRGAARARASARCARCTPSTARCCSRDARRRREAALDVLQAARDEVGDWPLLAALGDQLLAQEALLRAAVGEREAGARAARGRARARPRRRWPWPMRSPGCAC